MTDRELLELAAKALGIEVWTDVDGNLYTCMQDLLETPWNPLDDDCDAFRLLAASPYLDTQFWVTEAWQASNTEEGRRAHLRRRIVTAVASLFKIGEQNG